eukprot:Awhi_evm1s10390
MINVGATPPGTTDNFSIQNSNHNNYNKNDDNNDNYKENNDYSKNDHYNNVNDNDRPLASVNPKKEFAISSDQTFQLDPSINNIIIKEKVSKVTGYNITLKNVTYKVDVKDKENSNYFRTRYKPRTLLTNVNTSFTAGSLTALIGSSGAGKSTLMDLIAGRKK